MTVTTDHPPTSDGPDATAGVRLSLKPEGSPPGLLDGAWWPRSRDLNRELPALAGALDRMWGRVTRITVNPRYWPVVPRMVPVPGHVVKIGWFRAEQDPHKMMVLTLGSGRLDLLVVPPQASDAAAGRLMAAAVDPLHPRTASALMAAEEARSGTTEAGGNGHGQKEDWVSEGGALPRATAIGPARPTRLPPAS